MRIDIEPSITTVVGANESGNSHLLDAIEKLITGENIERSDFCRYSQFFSVGAGQRRSPDFGGEFEVINAENVAALSALGVTASVGDRLHLFRPNGAGPIIYSPAGDVVDASSDPSALRAILPTIFRLDAQVPLPVSIPLHELNASARRTAGSRMSRGAVFQGLFGRTWSSPEEFRGESPAIYGLLSSANASAVNPKDLQQQFDLGRALLFNVAKIDGSTSKELSDAIADEREGYVNAVIQRINVELEKSLNFPRWWAQDREFRLMVSSREHELVFTIRDRTGTDYSFSKRSHGLRFFLRYYVQILAHEPAQAGQPELLLMDEPDAFLSSQSQQDLLRILEKFSIPEDRSRSDQVIYVTHSPFLINRNAGERIRVLDKGVTDEGTRVVKDAARNHYEPLRSSLGVFVAETSSIGGSNLFVEGLADQVLLAGTSSQLLHKEVPKSDLLDLNQMTIVPCGSASAVLYLVYLARGRDVRRPPCVALLDGDDAGDAAVKALARGGPGRKELLPSRFVVSIREWAEDNSNYLTITPNVIVREIENLLSLPVALQAARNYAVRMADIPPAESSRLTEQHVASALENNSGSLFGAVQSGVSVAFGDDAHIDKVGFAKEVIAVCRGIDQAPGVSVVEGNLKLLLAEIARLLRQASREEEDRRLNNRLKRVIAAFLADHPTTTTREVGRLFIEDVIASTSDSAAGDKVHQKVQEIRRNFELDENLSRPIERYAEFLGHVKTLQYQERFDIADAAAEVGGD